MPAGAQASALCGHLRARGGARHRLPAAGAGARVRPGRPVRPDGGGPPRPAGLRAQEGRRAHPGSQGLRGDVAEQADRRPRDTSGSAGPPPTYGSYDPFRG
eukprot:scaffold114664_cov36-Prasinocladus_malaysianus.AAC.1